MSDNKTANCFVCNREIQLGSITCMSDDEQKKNPVDALQTEIAAGYGSCHDGAYGKMYVCDPCFGDRIDRLVDAGNYLDEYSEDDEIIESAEKIVRFEMVKLQHPSNYDFWKSAQEKFRNR